MSDHTTAAILDVLRDLHLAAATSHVPGVPILVTASSVLSEAQMHEEIREAARRLQAAGYVVSRSRTRVRVYPPGTDLRPKGPPDFVHVRERCSGCPHPRHTGMCTRRNGGTAYVCPCTRSTP